MFGHCNNCDVTEWAYKKRNDHEKGIKSIDKEMGV